MSESLTQSYWLESSWPRGTDERVLDPGLLKTEFLAQGY